MGKDETADLLASIAAQAYGAIAAAEEAGREIESLASVLLAPLAATPSHHACVAAMTVDPGLLALRPDEAGVKASLMLLSGGGSEIDLTKLPLALVNAAAEALVLSGEALTLDSLPEAAVLELERLRDVATKGRMDVLRLDGFRGVPLSPGQRIETPWGQLRSLAAPRWAVPLTILGSGFGGDATAMLVSREEEVVLVGHTRELPRPEFRLTLADLEKRQRITTELLPLALGLGTAGEDPVRAIWVWDTVLIPWTISRGWSHHATARLNLRQRSRPLEEDDLKEIERSANLVQVHYGEDLALAGRRIVSALTVRGSFEDVLVDAVIAWENLVGGETETTFRTSAAMACLLESVVTDRFRLQKRYSKLYGARSRVVHGRHGGGSLGNVADEALDVAIRGVKAIMERRPDLIPLDAATRSERLLLGG